MSVPEPELLTQVRRVINPRRPPVEPASCGFNATMPLCSPPWEAWVLKPRRHPCTVGIFFRNHQSQLEDRVAIKEQDRGRLFGIVIAPLATGKPMFTRTHRRGGYQHLRDPCVEIWNKVNAHLVIIAIYNSNIRSLNTSQDLCDKLIYPRTKLISTSIISPKFVYFGQVGFRINSPSTAQSN